MGEENPTKTLGLVLTIYFEIAPKKTCTYLFAATYIGFVSYLKYQPKGFIYLFIYWTYILPHSATSTLRAVYNFNYTGYTLPPPPSKLGTHFTDLGRMEG